MNYHTDLANRLPPGVRNAAYMIDWELTKGGRTDVPRLVDVTVPMRDDESGFVRFVFEIASGILIALGWYRTPAHYERAEYREDAVKNICTKACAIFKDHFFIKNFETIRTCAEDLVANARDCGLPVQLIDVRLTETGEFGENIGILLEIETLAHNLRYRTIFLTASDKETLKLKFSYEMDSVKHFVDARSHLKANGAHGTIDLLALNTLKISGRLDCDLRSMIDKLKITNRNDEELFWKFGRITSKSNKYKDVHWNENCLIINNIVLPDVVCAGALGRPVTDLIEGPAFSSNMMIIKVNTWPEEGLEFSKVTLDLPKYFFNINSNRIWPVPSRRTPPLR
ncbi:hypothetical protein [Sphingomonas sp. BAUL-RG-20F-R05-02]|uniref:hypothetical protein n=1 Tax=Sphingomonas sp. BAUL-RG-20F-R05-02 TaxID=2914830 RepID=UPI001F5A476A|nr:hypothetical protein [Sphingomonas sp. BAUL-RG-20F-R05-02]